MEFHPTYGRAVVRARGVSDGRWTVRIADIPLDEITQLLDAGWSEDRIAERYSLIMRSDLRRIIALRDFDPTLSR